MNGIEGMMNVLFRSMGINPQEILTGVGQFMQTVYTRLDEFDKRMTALENLCREIRDHQKGLEIVGQSNGPSDRTDICRTDGDTAGREAGSYPLRVVGSE